MHKSLQRAKRSIDRTISPETPAERLAATKRFFITSVILVAVATGLLGLAYRSEQEARHLNGSIATLHIPNAPNVTKIMGEVEAKISDITYTDGSASFTAPTGKQYLIVSFTVKNRSDRPINVFPSVDTYVKSASGALSPLTPVALDSPFRAGQLLPGNTINGQLSFLVSKTETNTFYVDSLWSGGVVPFSLSQ